MAAFHILAEVDLDTLEGRWYPLIGAGKIS